MQQVVHRGGADQTLVAQNAQRLGDGVFRASQSCGEVADADTGSPRCEASTICSRLTVRQQSKRTDQQTDRVVRCGLISRETRQGPNGPLDAA